MSGIAPVPGVAYTVRSGAFVAPGRPTYTPGWTAPAPEVAGALPLGSAAYDIPATGVLYVSTSGSDSNPGTVAAPKATLAAAVTAASAGNTIVIRGGEYRQSVPGNIGKALTIQNYPGEAVWFDGSDVVTGWVSSGGRWVKTGWTVEFDHSASYKLGSDAGGFTNAEHPLAAWPDQVWIDGVRQDIVASSPAAGQFSVDYAANTLTIGSDPTGKEVRATVRTTLMVVAAPCTLRGFGWRRYGTNLPSLAPVNIVTAGTPSRVENCHAEDSLQLLSIGTRDSLGTTVVHRNTFRGGGMTGVHSNNTQGCSFEFTNNIIDDTNWRGFDVQPAAGALRTARSLNCLVANNIITDTAGGGIWFDAWSRHVSIVNNVIDGAVDMAIMYETSQWAYIVGNRVRNATKQGIGSLKSADVEMWNNVTDRTNQFDTALRNDERGAEQEFGITPYTVRCAFKNNVVQNSTSKPTTGWRTVIYDSLFKVHADTMMLPDGVAGNVYTSDQAPTGATSASRMVGWGTASAVTAVTIYSTPAAFGNAKPIWSGLNALTSELAPSAATLAALAPTIGVPLPAYIADLFRSAVPAGTLVIGPPLPEPVPAA